jgi:hypothetical protein
MSSAEGAALNRHLTAHKSVGSQCCNVITLAYPERGNEHLATSKTTGELTFPRETKQMKLPPFGAPVHLGRVRRTHETFVVS